MPLNVTKELATLQQLSVGDLRERYTQLFWETTQARNRPWLIKRILWRMQSLEQGGLSERAIQRARELAATCDLRVTAPKARGITDGSTTRTIECPVPPSRTPLPGMLLTRRYKGQLIQVRVLANGYEYLGERYRSLSAIAKQITGSHCSGNRFFQLTNSTGDQ
jgi:Protein of unknown function (DUF2924)